MRAQSCLPRTCQLRQGTPTRDDTASRAAGRRLRTKRTCRIGTTDNCDASEGCAAQIVQFPGVAPAILWLQARGGGAKRSRLSSSGGPVSQRIYVPTRQTATRHAHAAGSRADHPARPAPPPHHAYLREPRISQQVPARVLDRPRVPAHRAGPAPHHRNRLRRAAPARCTPGTVHSATLVCWPPFLGVARLLTTVSSAIGCAFIRVAALGRGWCAAGGVW